MTPSAPRVASHGPGRRHPLVGLAAAVVLLPALTAVLLPLRGVLSFPSHLLLYLMAVVVIALLGGPLPAVATAVAASLLLNWYFVEPYGTLRIGDRDELLALAVFVCVALAMSGAMELAARRGAAAAGAQADLHLLAEVSQRTLASSALPDVLDRIRRTFGLRRVALEQQGHDGRWEEIEASGEPSGLSEGEADSVRGTVGVAGQPRHRLLTEGPPVFAADRRLLEALAAAAGTAAQGAHLTAQAATAEALAATDRLRTALLAAVGHDLRTPLAGIKAAVSGLRQDDIAWSASEQAELLATIEESTDLLTDLVANLLDMSRLQAGVLMVTPVLIGLDEVVAAALRSVDLPAGSELEVAVPDTLPLVRVDAGLLERVVANLVSNALRHAPGRPVRVDAEVSSGVVQLRVTDHGPGLPAEAREQIFLPFQRFGDAVRTPGIGLGLAVAKGFTAAMAGRLEMSDTPGGGVTMTVVLPRAARQAS